MAKVENINSSENPSEVVKVDLPAEIVYSDGGVPIKSKARILKLSYETALVEVNRELTKGEVIAVFIKDVDRDVYDLFHLDEIPNAALVTVKTRGKVLHVDQSFKSGMFEASILFQGNMRIVNEND